MVDKVKVVPKSPATKLFKAKFRHRHAGCRTIVIFLESLVKKWASSSCGKDMFIEIPVGSSSPY